MSSQLLTKSYIRLNTFSFPDKINGKGVLMEDLNTSNESLCCQPAEYNFNIIKGSDLDIEIRYKNESKNPIDLTGYTARCTAQYKDKIFTVSSVIEEPENGYIHLTMSANDTAKIFTLDYKYMNHTEYTYQLNIISPSNTVYRILQGIICVTPGAGY